MTFYHKTKDDAISAADPFAGHFSVRAELEPNNGWVIVLTPLSAEVFKFPLWEIMEKAEIELTAFPRLYRRPAGHKRPEPLARRAPTSSAGGSGDSPSAPAKGSTAKVWTIADRVYAEKGIDRAAIIAACVAEGINPATAATQYSKWKKTK